MATIQGTAFRQGQHICALYATADEQLDVAAMYVAEGLGQGERCLYVCASTAGLHDFRERLGQRGVDVGAAESRTALLLQQSDQIHLAGGQFESERMLRLLNEAVEQALNDGFTGLRTCGDMSWLLDAPEANQQVVEYEAVLNQFFRNVRATGMCQYDFRRLPAGLVESAGIVTHSSVVLDGHHSPNPFFADASDGRADERGLSSTLAALRRDRTRNGEHGSRHGSHID